MTSTIKIWENNKLLKIKKTNGILNWVCNTNLIFFYFAKLKSKNKFNKNTSYENQNT